MSKSYYWSLWIALIVLGTACRQSEEKTSSTTEISETPSAVVIQIEAEDFEAVSDADAISAADGFISKTGEAGWISFQADIPEAGRYRTEVHVSSADETTPDFWIEDYIDNPDGRTYNITGSMRIPQASADAFLTIGKDGSPLDKGLHPMKLHIGAGSAKVDWIKFTQLKKHQLTPDTLTQQTEGEEWVVVWSDEFEGEGLVDSTKWTYDLGNWGWGNNELQYYTEKRLKNARQENGNLIIEAHKNDMGEAWTSARLTTRGKETFRYGKIEMRAKVPVRKGNWAAGWTLGDSYVDEKSWPYCGEIDILESVGYELDDVTGDGKAHASIHCGAYYFKLGNQPTSTLEVADMHDSFHTYSIEWLPTGIKAFVDDQLYFEYNDTSSDLAWPYDEPQNIILNLAMGGGWGGAQGMDETVTNQKFVLDYVRVYELQ